MLIILVRHGETAWNSEKRYQGQNDSPLTNSGKEQAKKIASRLVRYKIDRLYSSPLGRALATAKIIANENKCEIVIEPLLKEINYGDFEGKSRDEISAKMPEEMKKREKDKYSYKYQGGESYKEMNEKRIKPFIEKLFKENKKDSVIVVVSHSGTNRLIAGNLIGIKGKEIMTMWQPNECIYFLEAEKGKKAQISYSCIDSNYEGKGYLKIPQEKPAKGIALKTN